MKIQNLLSTNQSEIYNLGLILSQKTDFKVDSQAFEVIYT